MIKVSILTVSNTRTEETDGSGSAIAELLDKDIYKVIKKGIVKDDVEMIKNRLQDFSDKLKSDVVFTSGGTGFGPYDVTPEATLEAVEKVIPGLSELIRSEGMKHTKRAALSRGVSGIRGKTLIINLPGSPKGAAQSLEIILDLIPHAVAMLQGGGH